MRWKGRRRSTNVEHRGASTAKKAAVGGVGGIIMALVAIFVLGKDPLTVMQGMQNQSQTQQAPTKSSPQEEAVKEFMEVVIADTEDTWGAIFKQAGQRYPAPKLVTFKGATQTACGVGQSASGPFYCPGDQDIYIDIAFLNELQRMGASGDFAVAYVLAHEVGHHIQTITGTSSKVRQLQSRASKAQSNDLQVRMELQADCYAGVWAYHTQKRTNFLERGDIEEALQAASSVGDDKIMRDAGIPPRKENFTHGTSEQRMQWFNRGIQGGDIANCDTGI